MCRLTPPEEPLAAFPNREPHASCQKPATGRHPLIIPVFLPHAGCPHRCIFCNQALITGFNRKIPPPDEVESSIRQYLHYRNKHHDGVQIAFFGGNFLGMETDQIVSLLRIGASFVQQGLADGIRFSTRPDTVCQKQVDMMRNFPISTVELGVQSMDDRILSLSRRGHTAADTVKAMQLLKDGGYETGVQMMVGLPGEDRSGLTATARAIANMKPDFVRIYPTLVIKGSPLAQWYERGQYKPLHLENAVKRVKNLYLFFRNHHIRIIRMGLQASADLDDGSTVLDGPYHPAFGQMVYSEIFLEAVESALKSIGRSDGSVAVAVHPRNISKMRGLKNINIKKVKATFNLKAVEILPDRAIAEDCFKIEKTIFPFYQMRNEVLDFDPEDPEKV